MNIAFLSLGTNLGDRLANLKAAEQALVDRGCKILASSSVYETEPWGNKDQPAFYNQVIKIETKLSAPLLMETILSVEKSLGRIRTQKWEPRVIDIDILFYNDEVFQLPHLIVPHPHLHERKFVLQPLAEIDPAFVHSVFKKTVMTLLNEMQDEAVVKKI